MASRHSHCVCDVCMVGLFTPERRLPRMDDLLRFSAVEQLGSFSSAARELGISRATMTQSMNRLEGVVGARLFSRAARRGDVTRMTPAGRALYPTASGIITNAAMIVDPES